MNTKGTDRTYWVQVFSKKTWQEFLTAGAAATGFRKQRWTIVKKLRPGDYLLCYLSKVGAWIAALEVVSEPYIDDQTKIWADELFPCRVNVRVVIQVGLDDAVPIRKLRKELSIFRSRNWGAHLFGSPTRFGAEDGDIVMRELTRTSSQRDVITHPSVVKPAPCD